MPIPIDCKPARAVHARIRRLNPRRIAGFFCFKALVESAPQAAAARSIDPPSQALLLAGMEVEK